MTKLWILRPVKTLAKSNNPWFMWFDKAFGFIVRAETEAEARLLVANSGETGDENASSWLDFNLSTCEELISEGPTGIIMVDFHAA